MSDDKRQELQSHVRALVHKEMHLLETYLTKRVMLMCEEIERLQHAKVEGPSDE